MPSLDIAMPVALFIVIVAALFLNRRVENKLVATVEQKQFKSRDILFLAAFIVVMVSVIAYTSMVNPGGLIPNILLILFMASYTTLLFTFSYVFTKTNRARAQIVSAIFGAASVIAGIACFLAPFSDAYTIIRAAAFFVLAGLCFSVVIYEKLKTVTRHRWYIAAQPPALFVMLFLFFAVLYNGTVNVWFPLLMDVFAFTFALLIILYLSALFNWKTVWIFAALLPIVDVILVFSGPMVAAAHTFTGLGLPVLVYLPNIPVILTSAGDIGLRGLGLGDFFFAGILVIQTAKKYGQKTGLIAAAAIAVSFGIWEAFLPDIFALLNIEGFPATVCIITGWLPIVAWKMLTTRNQAKASAAKEPAGADATQPNL
ncbi:MAG: hypothetical protein NWE93_12245 [Candidatus Bathyarchaeota archaeon]|nr:hypothetical protein [Candidatus Bathyarchaeota archaeon]